MAKKKKVKVSRKKGKVVVKKGKNTVAKSNFKNVLVKSNLDSEGKVIASFCGINFFVTREVALFLSNMKQNVSGKWIEHEILGKKPKSEFAGADLRSFSFDMMVDVRFGYKPHSIMKKVHQIIEKGKVDKLMIGTHKIGSKWKMTNASDEFDVVYAGGKVTKATITVTLKEY